MSLAQPISDTLSLPQNSPVVTATLSSNAPASFSSTEILRGQKTVEINHNGSTYRLQATRLGKLILTK